MPRTRMPTPGSVAPLSDFPPEHRARIEAAVAEPKPPPRWLLLGPPDSDRPLAKMESRAWYEWHWARGRTPNTRAPIAPVLRESVYARDGHRCLHCGTTENLSLDHIHPYSLGGDDTYDNLQTLCRSCNSRKGAKT